MSASRSVFYVYSAQFTFAFLDVLRSRISASWRCLRAGVFRICSSRALFRGGAEDWVDAHQSRRQILVHGGLADPEDRGGRSDRAVMLCQVLR